MARRAGLACVVLGFAWVAGCAGLFGNTDVPIPIDASLPATDGSSGSDAQSTGEGASEGASDSASEGASDSASEGASDSILPQDAPADVSGETGESGPPCNGGTCLAGQSCCGGCVDLQTDDSNCGSCGHACGGPGACQNGACQPIVLAQMGGEAIAVSGTTLFFDSGYDVYACPLAGCGSSPAPIYHGGDAGYPLYGIAFDVTTSELLVSDSPDVVAIGAHVPNVYPLEWRAAMPGLLPTAYAPTTSGNLLFVGGYNLIAQGDTQAILAGSGTANLTTLCSFTSDTGVFSLTYDPGTTSVFGAEPGSNMGGAIVKCLVGSDAGTSTSVATPPGAYDLVLSGQTVFVAVGGTPALSYADGGIYWSPTGTLSLNKGTVGSTYGGGQALTGDATYLYFWSNRNNVYRCSIASHCTDATIIASAFGVTSMTNDANFIYWLANGTAAKLAKPQ
jgi:hypothetical protein